MTETAPPSAVAGTTTRATLYSIQIMRALASVAVAVYHTRIILAQPEYGGIDVLGGIATKGWTGVTFFFVLSGFIIMYAHVGDIGRPARFGRYVWRRFSRIYPFYWLCLTAYIGAAAVGFGHPDFRWAMGDMVSSYALVAFVPDPSLPLHVAWTLLYEIAFYALFGVLVLNRRAGIVVFALWTLLILGNTLVLHDRTLWFSHAWNLAFILGIAAYHLFGMVPPRFGRWLLAGGVVLLVVMLAAGAIDERIGAAQESPVELLALALGFMLVLLGGALWERHSGWRPPGFLLLLGEASYSIYLLHSPALSVIAMLNWRFLSHEAPPLLVFAVAAPLSIAVGVVAHVAAERPLLRLLRKVATRAPRRPPVEEALAVER